jgi:hypothetical protein
MNDADRSLLASLARKYVWWMNADEASRDPALVIAQVMNLGDYDDMHSMATQVGDDALRAVIARAQPGRFNARSWTYWHYRLGLAALGQVPPLPMRRFE